MSQYQPYGNGYGTNTVIPPMYYKPQAQSFQQMSSQMQPYQYMQPYIAPTQAGLRGRIVSNPDEITPQEVPMDGERSIFPLADNSAVYMKAWTLDGNFNTIKFVPESAVIPVEPTQDAMSTILERLDGIESMLKQRNSRHTNQKSKNEGVNNE